MVDYARYERALGIAPWIVLAGLVATVMVQTHRLAEARRPIIQVLGLRPNRGKVARPTLVLVMQPSDCANAIDALDPVDARLPMIVNVDATFVGDDLSETEARSVAVASGLQATVHAIDSRDVTFIMDVLSIRTTPFAILVDTAGRIARVFLPPETVSIETVRASL